MWKNVFSWPLKNSTILEQNRKNSLGVSETEKRRAVDLFVDPLLRAEQTCSIRAAYFKNWQARGPGLGNLFVHPTSLIREVILQIEE